MPIVTSRRHLSRRLSSCAHPLPPKQVLRAAVLLAGPAPGVDTPDMASHACMCFLEDRNATRSFPNPLLILPFRAFRCIRRRSCDVFPRNALGNFPTVSRADELGLVGVGGPLDPDSVSLPLLDDDDDDDGRLCPPQSLPSCIFYHLQTRSSPAFRVPASWGPLRALPVWPLGFFFSSGF